MGTTVDPFRLFVKNTRKKALIFGAFLGVVLFLAVPKTICFGYICGAAVSVVNFQLMAADAFGMIEKSSRMAKKFILFRYFLRYAILFAAMALIATRTDFNIFAAFSGVFTVQAVLFGERLLELSHAAGRVMKG